MGTSGTGTRSGGPPSSQSWWDVPLLELQAPPEGATPSPLTPVLVSGLRAAAILSSQGDLDLPWDTRGSALQWGGVYAQGVRLTGPWTIEVGRASAPPVPLASSLRSLSARRHEMVSLHAGDGWTARQEIVVPVDEPAVTRKLVLTGMDERGIDLVVRMSLEPFAFPVLMEGLRPPNIHLQRTPQGLSFQADGYAGNLVSSDEPATLRAVDRPLPASPEPLPHGPVELTWSFHLDPAERLELSWVLWGGLERDLKADPERGRRIFGRSSQWREERRGAEGSWWEERPVLRFPQDPLLEEGARLAMGALRALQQAPEPDMVGHVAGYPWYCSLWFRDIAWMLPASLWLGDHEWGARTLRTAFHFQSRTHIPILGAQEGEVPMQVSPGPIFLYGTSDTTLHFPALADRLWRHAGPSVADTLRGFMPSVAACLAWADRKVEPATGLFANGGEIAEMSEEAQHGAVQCGFDAHDTTIWDSTDRRAHAIDLQVLHVRALRAAAALHRSLDDPNASAASAGPRPEEQRADAIVQKVLKLYGWPEESYLVDTLAPGGGGLPVRKLRPNALLTVMDGWLPRERAQAMVRRALREDLTTAWGVRTLSRSDPTFDPEAYHDGQVWTIATDWAAHAALAAGLAEEGVGTLHTVSSLLREEHGLANECYHGLEARPFNSCFLLGLSVGPFLTALFEGLWGLSVRGSPATLRVAPVFPAAWKGATLERLRIGETRLDLHWAPGTVRADHRGGPPLRLENGLGEGSLLAPGGSLTLALRPPAVE